MSAISVIFPAVPEAKIDMPESMRPEDRAFLIKELGKISGELAVKDERIKTLTVRVEKLEAGADASGEHKALVLQKQLEHQMAVMDRWKGRVWAIVATLITSAIVGLVVHYLSSR